MSEYQAFAGIVAFSPTTDEVSGTPIQRVTIKLVNSPDATLVSATLWGALADTEVNVGDFIVVEGKFTQNTKGDRTYNNVNANTVLVIPTAKDEKKASAPASKPKIANAKPKVSY
jgi:hypothetical protein